MVEALLAGEIVQAHLADRGRLKETLVPEARLLLARRNGTGRKTMFQAVAAYRGCTLVSLDTHLPNRLIEAALRARALPQFETFSTIRREVKIGASRFDFQLSDGSSRCTVEVRSAGLIVDGVGLFPDAPTVRGRRHLQELAALVQASERAAVLFVVQGGDAHTMTVHTTIDPLFDAALREAAARGVEVYAYACPLTPAGIMFGAQVPVVGISDCAAEIGH
jgi:sugar fermentation stimulation protein A